MTGIFISYRRDDSQGWASRLADDLAEALGPDLVFSDVEIPIGSDFGDVLHRAIAACDVLLVVIGRRWAAAEGPGGQPRLFDPDDWVRTEIEVALTLGKPVIPLPVGGAELPPAAAVPVSLRPMLRLQAAPLSPRHWRADVAALADQLRPLLPAAPAPRTRKPATPAPGVTPDTLAAILREIADQARREERSERVPALPNAAGGGWVVRLLRGLGRRLGRLLGLVLLLGAAWAGLRLFGDPTVQRLLDLVERRVLAAVIDVWRQLHAP